MARGVIQGVFTLHSGSLTTQECCWQSHIPVKIQNVSAIHTLSTWQSAAVLNVTLGQAEPAGSCRECLAAGEVLPPLTWLLGIPGIPLLSLGLVASPQCPPEQPGATSCTPNLAREHFGFLLHSAQVSCQSPLSMHRFPSPCWPCAACPVDFWALTSPACPTPGRVCALQEKQDVPCSTQPC